MDTGVITEQIKELLAEYQRLLGRSQYANLKDLPMESKVLVVQLRTAIDRLAPSASLYRSEAEAKDAQSVHVRIPVYVGILEALRKDIDCGWLTTVEELLRADTFSGFIDMASELLAKNYKDPAAVLIGAVLEAHLRALVAKAGLPTADSKGRHKSADAMNTDLAKSGVYNVLRQKQVTAWQAIRNASAHGNFGDYAPSDVRSLIDGVRDFVVAFPA